MDRSARRFEVLGRRAAAAVLVVAASLVVATAVGDEPEHGMDKPVMGSDPLDQHSPSVAAGDLGYLVVWTDQPPYPLDVTYRDIRGARLTPNGVPIVGDEQGFLLGSALTLIDQVIDGPSVAFGGASYLVTWSDTWTIQTALVAPSGPSTVLDSDHFGDNGFYKFYPVAARADAGYVVAWLEVGFNSFLRGARVGGSGGSLTLGKPFTIAELTGNLSNGSGEPLALACASVDCLAVYADFGYHHIYGTIITYDDITYDDEVSAPFLISTDAADPQKPEGGQQFVPAVAFDGTNYVVVWMSVGTDPQTVNQVRGSRVGLNGAVLDPGGIEIAALGSFPQISARAGSPALVTWAAPTFGSSGSSHAARVDTDPAASIKVLPSGGVSFKWYTPEVYKAPVALDSTGAEGLAVFSTLSPGGTLTNPLGGDIFASTVKTSPALTITNLSEAISKNWNHQTGPAVTFLQANNNKENGYLVIWKDSRFSGSLDNLAGLAVARLNDKGEVLPTNQQSSSNISTKYTATLSVAAGSENILIGWLEYEPPSVNEAPNLKAVLAGHDGVISSIKPIVIPMGEDQSGYLLSELSTAFDGSAYVLVWSTGDRVRAARLSTGGDVLEAGALVYGVSPLEYQIANVVSVHAGGGDFLTFWNNEWGIFCKSFSTASGQISVSNGAPKMIAELSDLIATEIAVAYGGDGAALVVWRNNTPTGGGALYGTRLNKSCERLDGGFSIAEDDTFKGDLRVIFDGASYLAVWGDGSAIYGAWISRDGIAHASSGFLVAEVAEEEVPLGQPVIASDGAGRSLVAFTRSHFTDETGFQFDVNRVRAKLIDNGCEHPAAVSCESSEKPCFAGGACDPETLNCSPPSPRPDGAPCPGGLCIGGECVPEPNFPTSSGASSSSGGNSFDGEAGCACEAVGAGRGSAPPGLAFAALLAIARAWRVRRGRSPAGHLRSRPRTTRRAEALN